MIGRKDNVLDEKSVARFTPVSPFETPLAMDALCEAYAQAQATESIDALILIPCFIVDFLCIHPFNDGNGRTSRVGRGEGKAVLYEKEWIAIR